MTFLQPLSQLHEKQRAPAETAETVPAEAVEVPAEKPEQPAAEPVAEPVQEAPAAAEEAAEAAPAEEAKV